MDSKTELTTDATTLRDRILDRQSYVIKDLSSELFEARRNCSQLQAMLEHIIAAKMSMTILSVIEAQEGPLKALQHRILYADHKGILEVANAALVCAEEDGNEEAKKVLSQVIQEMTASLAEMSQP